MTFFTPADFSLHLSHTNSRYVADHANRLLQERGVRVYGDYLKEDWSISQSLIDGQADYTALLVCIEPLAKACVEHEPVRWQWNETRTWDAQTWECKHCGVKLRAKWESAE